MFDLVITDYFIVHVIERVVMVSSVSTNESDIKQEGNFLVT